MWNKIKTLFSSEKETEDEGDGKTILIIEDSEVDMRLIEKSFQKTKYRILKATGGDAGIQMVQEEIPDVVILDCLLPQIRGEDICRKLKEDGRTKHIPIIILTVLETNILECYEAGATKYLNKPVAPKALRAEVRDALENPEPLMRDDK
jgi:two-component system phosphate regulon response regulator PhoB